MSNAGEFAVTSRQAKGSARYEVVNSRGHVIARCDFPQDAIAIEEAVNAYNAAEIAKGPFEPGDRPFTPHYAPFG